MKPAKLIAVLFKTILPIAGIIVIISRWLAAGKNNRYRFTIDAAITDDTAKLTPVKPLRRFGTREFQKVYFRSLV